MGRSQQVPTHHKQLCFHLKTLLEEHQRPLETKGGTSILCVIVGRAPHLHCCLSAQKAIAQNSPPSPMPSSNATLCKTSPLPSSQLPHTSWPSRGSYALGCSCWPGLRPPTRQFATVSTAFVFAFSTHLARAPSTQLMLDEYLFN